VTASGEGFRDRPGMSPARMPHRRILLPFVLAVVLAIESIAVASTVVARSAATDGSTAVAAPFVPLASDPGARERSAADDVPVFDPQVAPIAEPAAPVRVLAQPALASVNKAKSQAKPKSVGSGGVGSSAPASVSGRNRMWFPALGINRPVYFFSCSNKSYPGNVVYRWGCAGSNNVYLFAHAHAAFKPLHDAYVNGRLKKGMKVMYADAKGKVRTYKLIWWKVTTPTNGSWAFAGQSRPSLTLQTCVGANSKYRLIVRFVQI
jgi:sortase (surface protein transpeptidase)